MPRLGQVQIHNLLQETQKFLRERSSSTATPSSDKNPLFTFAVTYLQNIQESRGFVSSNSNQHKNPPTTSPQAPGARYKPGGLELAAAASTTPAASSSPPPASTAPTTTGPNPYQHEGKTTMRIGYIYVGIPAYYTVAVYGRTATDNRSTPFNSYTQ